MTWRPRARLALLAVGLLGFIAASCGSSAPTTTSSSAPSTSTVPTTTTSATTTTTPINHTTCSTGVLQASSTYGGAAAGEVYDTVTLKNTGPSSCEVEGYPTYSFFGPSAGGGAGAGPKVSIDVTEGGPAPAPVTVSPGSTTDSIVVFTDVQTNGSSCVTIASADISPPGSSESIPFPISISPCGGSVTVYAFGKAGTESP